MKLGIIIITIILLVFGIIILSLIINQEDYQSCREELKNNPNIRQCNGFREDCFNPCYFKEELK